MCSGFWTIFPVFAYLVPDFTCTPLPIHYCDEDRACLDTLAKRITTDQLNVVFGIENKGCEMKYLSRDAFAYCFNSTKDDLDACFTDKIEGTVTCDHFNYDFTSSGSRNDSELTSVVSDMDLVCDQAWTVPFTISMYSIAVIIGSMIGTPISDRYGRRPAFIIAAVGTVVFGVPQAFAPNWWSLMVLRESVTIGLL